MEENAFAICVAALLMVFSIDRIALAMPEFISFISCTISRDKYSNFLVNILYMDWE